MKEPGENDWAGKLQSCQVMHVGKNDLLITCWIDSGRAIAQGLL